MTRLRLAFLALAVWGALHPMYWFLKRMRETGTGLSGMIDAWCVNDSTTGLTWDLTIATIALRPASGNRNFRKFRFGACKGSGPISSKKSALCT